MPTPTKAGYHFTNWKHADCVNLVDIADHNISYSASNGSSSRFYSTYINHTSSETYTYTLSFDYKFNSTPSNPVYAKVTLSTRKGPIGFRDPIIESSSLVDVAYPNLSSGRVVYTLSFTAYKDGSFFSAGYVDVNVYLAYSSTAQDINVDISHVQLEEGSTATEFIPYYITSTTQKRIMADATLKALYAVNDSYLSSNWADRIGRANLYNYTKELLFTKDASQIAGYSNSISVGTNSVTDTSAYVQSTTIDDVRAYYNDYSKIVFYSPCTIYAPENSSWLFAPKYDLEPVTYNGTTYYPWGLPSFTSMTFDNFNTSYVKDMSYMFRGSGLSFSKSWISWLTGLRYKSYSQMTSLDIYSFSTSNVTNAKGMFYGQEKLTSLKNNDFYSSCTDMSYMFYSCESLTSLTISLFQTSKVTNMSYMFGDCLSLTSLDIGKFDLTACTSFGSMLSNCSALASITLPYNLQSEYTISLPASTYYNGSAGPYDTIGTATSGTTVACSTSSSKVTLTKKE